MFDSFGHLPVGHDLNSSKPRTSDVLLDETVKFSSLLLEEKIQSGLSKCGYVLLSPIQKNALPLALTGTSLIAHAKSGTGKTLVYLLTALNICVKTKSKNLQCLVLAPTREIAKQVYDVFKNVGRFIEDLNIEYFIGGTPLDLDVIKCKNCNIAIGAPGRIKHLIDLSELKVAQLQLLVLDEVDALLNNKEFAVLELVSHLPTARQNIVCTATFSENIKTLLNPISPEIKYVTINENASNEDCSATSNVLIGVRQYVAPVFSDSTTMDTVRKRNKLVEILQNFKYDQCFIFVNYISLVKSVCNFLATHNLTALWVSSEQNQSTRIFTLNKLKMNECQILVTTDLAARGIDVHSVNLVINLGTPCPPEVYIHRMGRAGRYGSPGAVITIAHEGDEIEQFKRIVSAVSTDPVDLYVLPSEITTNLCDDQLQVIKCEPRSDPDLEQEYRFRRNVNPSQGGNGSGGGGGAAKKKNKNKKKKTPPKAVVVPEVVIPETKRDVTVDSDCITDESKPPTISSTSENGAIEKMIQLYVESIKEEIGRMESLDADTLSLLFSPAAKTMRKIRFTDYTRPPRQWESIRQYDATGSPPDVSVLEWVSFIRSTNAFLDEQKIPCSIGQFLDVFDRDEGVFTEHTAAGFGDLLKDVLLKIRELAHALISKNHSLNRAASGPKRSLKRLLNRHHRGGFGQASDSRSDGTEDSCNILKETSNWLLGRSNPHRSPKRTCKNMPCEFEATNETQAVNARPVLPSFSGFIRPIPIIPVADSSGDQLKVKKAQAKLARRVANDFPPPPPPPPLGNAARLQVEGDVQCPHCHSRFNLPSSQVPSVLQPLRAFVNTDTERHIWQSHFNFISGHVRSLASMFGNR